MLHKLLELAPRVERLQPLSLCLLCDLSHDYCSFSSVTLKSNLRYVVALTTYSLRVVGL